MFTPSLTPSATTHATHNAQTRRISTSWRRKLIPVTASLHDKREIACGRTNSEIAVWLANRALALADRVTSSGRSRCTIGLAGCPGGGKSTTSSAVAKAINDLSGAEIAVVLPMDGFHYYRHQLDRMPDPAEAHRRRGAPWTFDGDAFVESVRAAREGLPVSVPSFDHAVGDPVPGAIRIGEACKIVVVEGNYLLFTEDPWARLPSELLDETWFVDVGVDEAMERIVERHMAANGDSREVAIGRVAGNDRPNAEAVWATRERAQVLVPSLPLF